MIIKAFLWFFWRLHLLNMLSTLSRLYLDLLWHTYTLHLEWGCVIYSGIKPFKFSLYTFYVGLAVASPHNRFQTEAGYLMHKGGYFFPYFLHHVKYWTIHCYIYILIYVWCRKETILTSIEISLIVVYCTIPESYTSG